MKPFASIVTGTYNRLNYLQDMIRSARNSIGIGIPYEIVVVDGGSNDGTIPWCKNQLDIVLIEHGKLLGAVKAFNEGARKAHGDYVILANDDIIFIDESIVAAIRYMQDNPTCGIGCFFQDRYNKDWHVEIMPAVLNDEQISTWYGQVCIVPKWLGDKVGWWGNYLRTYGGDNELSCNVLELGYNVTPIPCACIHDTTPSDELRRINNPTKSNKDTELWREKWTRGRFLGPKIGNRFEEYVPNPIDKKFRILYAPIYEKGYAIQKHTKHGLRDSLSKIGLVLEVDYVSKTKEYIFDVADSFKPDLIITQIQSCGDFYADTIAELREENPQAIMVNWNGDYHPEHLYDRNFISMMKEFDLCGFVTTEVADIYNNAGVNWVYWQIGYEIANNYPDDNTPTHDIVFLANGYSENRLKLGQFLRSLPYDVGLYGIWPEHIGANGSNLYDFDAGAKLYSQAHIAIGDSQWPSATGFVSNRLFQSMSAGAFLLHQHFDGMDELLGIKDGKHIVVWRSLDDLREKIEYYLQHRKERRKIATAGQLFVLNRHSFDIRVAELVNALRI